MQKIKSQMNNSKMLICIFCQKAQISPKMCPHCSEVYCQMCIREYLRCKHFCPSCDNYIINVIDCTRLLSDIRQKISEETQEIQVQQNYPSCEIHNLPLQYYCYECQKNICSDCGIIENIHKNHNISKDEKINHKKQSRNKMQKQLIQVDQEILKFYKKQEQCGFQLELIKSQIKWARNKLTEHYNKLINKLNKQAHQTINRSKKTLQNCKRKLQYLKKVRQQLNCAIINENYKGNQIVQLREQFLQNHELYPSSTKKQIQILQELDPPYSTFMFQMPYINEPNLVTETYSQNYNMYGYYWRLKVYPNGNPSVQNQYMSVFLELVDQMQSQRSNFNIGRNDTLINQLVNDNDFQTVPIQYYYRIQLLNLNKAQNSIIKQYCSTFRVGQCWGYNNFLPIEDIKDYLHQGQLIFVLSIKNTSYFQLYNAMKFYVQNLEKQHKTIEELLKQSNQSIHSSSSRRQLSISNQFSIDS